MDKGLVVDTTTFSEEDYLKMSSKIDQFQLRDRDVSKNVYSFTRKTLAETRGDLHPKMC